MILGIDIDDTIMDSFSYFQPFLAEFLNVDLEYLIKNKISYSNIPKSFSKSELDFAKTYYDKVVVDTPIKVDAKFYLDKLKEDGHKIIIITARDTNLYTDPYATTMEQLKKNNIIFDKLICSRDKAKVCLDEQVDIFIDDSIDNCIKVSECSIKTILFSSIVNKNLNSKSTRVFNWKQLYNCI